MKYAILMCVMVLILMGCSSKTTTPYDTSDTTNEYEKEVSSDTYNLYGKNVVVLDWYGNSLNAIRPKEIVVGEKKYIYEYEYFNCRSRKKVYDDVLVDEVLYEYARDNMDMPILKKEVHQNYDISYIWQETEDGLFILKGFEYKGNKYFYQNGDKAHPYWIKYINNENGDVVAEYKYTSNDEGIIECKVINYTEENIGIYNPIRYEKDYCDYETGFIVGNSSYYFMKSNYVAVRPNLGG